MLLQLEIPKSAPASTPNLFPAIYWPPCILTFVGVINAFFCFCLPFLYIIFTNVQIKSLWISLYFFGAFWHFSMAMGRISILESSSRPISTQCKFNYTIARFSRTYLAPQLCDGSLLRTYFQSSYIVWIHRNAFLPHFSLFKHSSFVELFLHILVDLLFTVSRTAPGAYICRVLYPLCSETQLVHETLASILTEFLLT